MKLKRLPEDFCVEELSDFGCTGGDFAVYQLRKRSIGTPEAIDAILQRWKLRRERVSFGGMKDRHAETVQRLTIFHGPKRGLKQNNLEINYLGQAGRAFAPADITANRFVVVLRDMGEVGLERAAAALGEVGSHGFPNYFDDQRFGSVGESGEFVAKPWCLGDFERALWLAIAEPNVHDRPADKDRKRLLREKWGQWPVLAAELGRSPVARILVRLIERPGDFRHAFSAQPAHVRQLLLDVFQSFIWNRMLARFIEQNVPAERITPVKFDHDTLPFQRSLPPELLETAPDMTLPLPSARAKFDHDFERELCDHVLRDLGIELAQLKTKFPRDVYFSRGNRPAFIFPTGVGHRAADDELHPGRQKLTLRFDLPRGAYATILVKRITTVAAAAAATA